MRIRIKETYVNVGMRGKTGVIEDQIGPVVRVLLDDGQHWTLSPDDFSLIDFKPAS